MSMSSISAKNNQKGKYECFAYFSSVARKPHNYQLRTQVVLSGLW